MKVMVSLWVRTFLVHDCENSSVTVRTEAQLAIPRHLREEARLLGIGVSRFEKTLSQLEKLRPENLGVSVASLMSYLSKAVEEFKHAEKKEAASTAAKVGEQAHLESTSQIRNGVLEA